MQGRERAYQRTAKNWLFLYSNLNCGEKRPQKRQILCMVRWYTSFIECMCLKKFMINFLVPNSWKIQISRYERKLPLWKRNLLKVHSPSLNLNVMPFWDKYHRTCVFTDVTSIRSKLCATFLLPCYHMTSCCYY